MLMCARFWEPRKWCRGALLQVSGLRSAIALFQLGTECPVVPTQAAETAAYAHAAGHAKPPTTALN